MGIYQLIRYRNTDVEYIVNVEFVEELNLTWKEALKYAKNNYSVVRTDKRRNTIIVK